MPNHLHLVGRSAEPDFIRHRLSRLLATLSRTGKEAGIWEPVPSPSKIADDRHLLRTIRYVLLNPCRAGLTLDPLEWRWSSLRELIGARTRTWVSALRVSRDLGWEIEGFRERFHRYLVTDGRTSPGASIFPSPSPESAFPSHGLESIASASLAANAGSYRGARFLFFHLARFSGYRNAPLLGSFAGTDRSTPLKAWRRRVPPSMLAAGRLCLGDARLRAGSPTEFPVTRKSTTLWLTEGPVLPRREENLLSA